MAKIVLSNLDAINLTFDSNERSASNETIHSAVDAMYSRQGYDCEPKNRQEADAQGKRDFNGLTMSVREHTIDSTARSVHFTLAPIRYLYRQAYADLLKASPLTYEDQGALSPNIFGTALIAPVLVDGKPYLLSQIKGKALGSGEVHAGLVAGGMKTSAASKPNPLLTTLRAETKEELGLDLDRLDTTDFSYVMDERETGHLGVYAVLRQTDLNNILGKYEAATKQRFDESKEPEVMGVANLPVGGLALEAIGAATETMRCFIPSPEGLIIKEENRRLRPPSVAWREHLQNPENLTVLLQRAGL